MELKRPSREWLRRIAVIATTCGLVATLSGFRYSGWKDTAAKTTAANATTWLKNQQLSDGSFETAGFPGFETPDAILAIAENAQLQQAWSASQARTAVLNTVKNGYNPLHAIDDLADDPALNAGQAAKLIVLVAKPLGIASGTFDPD